MNSEKKRLLPVLLALSALLLCGCFAKAPLQNDISGSPRTSETGSDSASELADLKRQLETLMTSVRLQSESYEERLRELEQALRPGERAPETNGTDFTYEPTEGGVLLTGWRGTGRTLSVPGGLDGKRVVGIADGAFRDCELESVVIGDGVAAIGWFAFSGCYRLTSVSVPASVTAIGYGAFERCASGLRMICPSGSYAERYAISYGIPVSAR